MSNRTRIVTQLAILAVTVGCATGTPAAGSPTGMEQLTFNTDLSRRANQPRFTPDGEWLLVTADTGPDRELWLLPAAGGDPVVVEADGIHTHAAMQPG
jgi:hypothetical protein